MARLPFQFNAMAVGKRDSTFPTICPGNRPLTLEELPGWTERGRWIRHIDWLIEDELFKIDHPEYSGHGLSQDEIEEFARLYWRILDLSFAYHGIDLDHYD